MGFRRRKYELKKAAAIVFLPFAALNLASCATAGPEKGVTVEEVLKAEGDTEEPVGDDSGGYDSLVGEQVTVSAEVNEIVSPMAFTIAGTDDTTVDELLIVHDEELPDVDPGQVVQVTGRVHEAFDLARSEEDLGIDLDEDLYDDWNDLRYIQATSVDTSVENN
ncbi:hypothetical protein [Arthrobacter zhaoguopingii]|uniref:hypothetical protein n=1 Tax=Arthrobacter zhaoguopingii TaxID=2681491 RepID=UPI00135BD374|nr:hypothetical protein [Arthrobacter zhaoguopingii]